jgi:parallel beta-helix repeat protein
MTPSASPPILHDMQPSPVDVLGPASLAEVAKSADRHRPAHLGLPSVMSHARRISTAIAVTAALFCLCFGMIRAPALAQNVGTLYVAPGGDCGGMQPCYSHPQDAVDAARDGGTIRVATGTYRGVRARLVSYQGVAEVFTQALAVSKTLTLRGGYSLGDWEVSDPTNHPTILDAERSGRVLLVVGRAAARFEALTFTGGSAPDANGGGALVQGSSVTLRDCQFSNSTADRGGGLCLDHGSAATLVRNALSGNTAEQDGGGLYVDESVAELRGNTVSSNVARGDGGGISLNDLSLCTLSGNTVADNTAHSDGGGFSVRAASALHLIGDTVSGNTALSDGGGIALKGSSAAWLSDTMVMTNTAQDDGGGVAVSEGTLLVSGAHLVGNVAGDSGGGLYLVAASNAIIQDSLIWECTANGGGGLCVSSGSYAALERNTVTRNLALVDGGALYLRDHSLAEMSNNVVSANTAGDDGGGFYLEASALHMERNRVEGNTAHGDGGGFALRRFSELELSRDLVLLNDSIDDGGAFYVASGAPFTLTNSVVAGNQAADTGGGLWVTGTPLGLSRGVMRHNTFAQNGDAAVRAEISVTLQLVNTIIAGHETGVVVTARSTVELEATLWGGDAWANGTDTAGAGSILTGAANYWGAPRFVDPGAGNFHIQADSPARDIGVDAGVGYDLDGLPRPIYSGFDIGADEFFPVVATLRLPVLLKGHSR